MTVKPVALSLAVEATVKPHQALHNDGNDLEASTLPGASGNEQTKPDSRATKRTKPRWAGIRTEREAGTAP